MRLGACPDLAAALGVPPDQRSLNLTELPKALVAHLSLYEPLAIQHPLTPGQHRTTHELLLSEPEPLHQQRAATLRTLAAHAAGRPAASAPLDADLEASLTQLRRAAAKRSWLRALLYETAAGGEGGEEGEGGAGGAGGEGAEADGAAGEPLLSETAMDVDEGGGEGEAAGGARLVGRVPCGSRLRSLEGFARALLASQVSTHQHTPAHHALPNTP